MNCAEKIYKNFGKLFCLVIVMNLAWVFVYLRDVAGIYSNIHYVAIGYDVVFWILMAYHGMKVRESDEFHKGVSFFMKEYFETDGHKKRMLGIAYRNAYDTYVGHDFKFYCFKRGYEIEKGKYDRVRKMLDDKETESNVDTDIDKLMRVE